MTNQRTRALAALDLLKAMQADPASPVTLSSSQLQQVIGFATEGKAPPTTFPNSWKMVYKWTSPAGTTAQNVLWGTDPSFTGLDTQLALVTSAMEQAMLATGSMLTVISPSWTLTSIEAFDNTGNTNNYSVVPVSHPGTYTGAGNPLPPNCAMVTGWDINEKYKGGHPRTYWPGVGEGMFAVAGAINFTAAFIAALKAAAIAFLTALVSQLSSKLSASEVGTMSLFANKAPRPSAQFKAYAVNTATVHSRMDSQRRRLGKEVTTF